MAMCVRTFTAGLRRTIRSMLYYMRRENIICTIRLTTTTTTFVQLRCFLGITLVWRLVAMHTRYGMASFNLKGEISKFQNICPTVPYTYHHTLDTKQTERTDGNGLAHHVSYIPPHQYHRYKTSRRTERETVSHDIYPVYHIAAAVSYIS